MPSTIKLAIADDHEIVRKGIIEMLSTFGFSVVIDANDGKVLYNSLLQCTELPDLVIMDISMQHWDGYETLDAIRKKWPDLKVLILTMHKHEFAIIKMFRSGANGYLLKNCNPTELQKAIITIHEKGLYFSEIVSNHLFHRIKNTYLLPSLTEKEIQLLKLCYSDLTYKEIGVKMGVSERSVAGYRDNLFKKFEVNSRPALVVCAIKMGLVAID